MSSAACSVAIFMQKLIADLVNGRPPFIFCMLNWTVLILISSIQLQHRRVNDLFRDPSLQQNQVVNHDKTLPLTEDLISDCEHVPSDRSADESSCENGLQPALCIAA